jgi:hypothetical protein
MDNDFRNLEGFLEYQEAIRNYWRIVFRGGYLLPHYNQKGMSWYYNAGPVYGTTMLT